jgi:ATP/maltotriose-dependent transcriptional regulator MalT
MVHRAELLQFHGEWPNAMEEAKRACERLSQPRSRPWAGAAFYQQGEICRLRGDFDRADEAYRLANEWGRSPQPGLALVRLAQGRTDAAMAAVTRELKETHDHGARARLLPAHVEILLAAGEVEAAQASAAELGAIAEGLAVPLLDAVSAQTRGAVALAKGEAVEALALLREAWKAWYEFEAPYEAARVRVLIAQACRGIGDFDTADLELDAARQVFRRLGAGPDLARLPVLGEGTNAHPGGLTDREVEILRLVAAGKSNHAIAVDLVVSDHTVRRHLQNIFAKLGVSSRSGATAFAFQHDLV